MNRDRELSARSRAARNLALRDICFIFSFCLGLILVLNRNSLLPDRFLGDEGTIQDLAQQVWESPEDSSYNSVALVYRVLGLAFSPVLAAMFGFLIACVPYILVLAKMRDRFRGGLAVLVLGSGMVLSAVYMGTYSKEVFIAPIIALFMLLKPSRWSALLLFAIMCFYAQFFRNYWYSLAIVLAGFMLLRAGSVRWGTIFRVAPLVVVVGSVAIFVVMRLPGDYYRSSVNMHREAYGDVNTLIPRYVELFEPLGGAVNNLLSFVFLQFPLPLLLKFSPYYAMLALFIGSLWFIYYRSMRSLTLRNDVDSAQLSRAGLLMLAFVVTQSFFEPDYGSALKHLTPFIPILLWVYLGSRVVLEKERPLKLKEIK